MTKYITFCAIFTALVLTETSVGAQSFFDDTTKTYAAPRLAKTPQAGVLLTWTEKDPSGMAAFCMASSGDAGQTFADKRVIYASTGIGGSRLMQPKVLFKKNGDMVAVFSNRSDTPTGKRSLDILFSVSNNNGVSWSAPQSVDADPTKGIVRGFYDAVVLPNDEIAVAYLKDVAGSTKHEERDLRLVVTKNGVFAPERVIDSVVCDCCNVSLLVDATGALQVYYRDNNDDIRDMARLTSTDNAATFSKSAVVHTDNWKIKGCPHSGAVSGVFGNSALVTWFSGAADQPGIRLTTQEGKRLAILSEPSAKNASVSVLANTAVWLWEQNQGEAKVSQIGFKTLNAGTLSETVWVKNSENATNASSVLFDKKMVVVYEVKKTGQKTSIRRQTVDL